MAVLADRLGLRGGFVSVSHVMVGLWSSEVLHTVRLRGATFRSLCPDAITAFEARWSGHPPDRGRTSTFVVLDPFARGVQRQWIDLQDALKGARSRLQGTRRQRTRMGL